MPKTLEDLGLNLSPYADILAGSRSIASDILRNLKELEHFENQYCKTRTGRELNLSSMLRLNDTKKILSDSYRGLKMLEKQIGRVKAARDIIESTED